MDDRTVRDPVRPWAVVVEIVGWVCLSGVSFVAAWIVVMTKQVCEELTPLAEPHGGCGINVAVAGAALAVAAVLWLASVALIAAGRRWRRPRRAPLRR